MFDISIKTVLPKSGKSHSEQLEDCLSQLEIILSKENIPKANVLKQSIFINVENNKSFKLIKNKLTQVINNFFETIPSTGFIGQIPLDNKKVAIDFTFLKDKQSETEIDFKFYKGFRYSILYNETFKTLYCNGISSENLNTGVLEQTQETFRIIKDILSNENMNFSNIIRQWNYIENITGFDQNREEVQNYQVFNDIRSEYYKKDNFINGYPSATGIGMNAGGIVIEFIAAAFSKDIEIIPISSPVQYDAHKYSKEVLVGEPENECLVLSTPKFERAKAVQTNKKGIVFVSGTAAIDGQTTIINSTIEKQTNNTIDNIKQLISKDNLQKFGISVNKSYFSNIRAYIKKEKDIIKVKKIFNREFKNVDILYLKSDICREKLLVEIEGILNYKK